MKLRLVLLAFLITSAGWAQTDTRIYASGNSSKMTYRNSNGLNSFNIEVRGKIEVTDDDRDIKSMSSDGYLEITKTTFGSKRTLKITAEGSTLKREYYEGRTQLPYEPEGRKWLSEVLPEVVRTTTIAAESRVNRFYKKGGVPAVLSEIEAMESSYMKSHYANLLMKLPVTTKDYPLIITKVSSGMESDHYLTEFLDNNMNLFVKNKESVDAVFAATNKMESDHYKTQIIKEALRTQPASVESVKIILASTAKMESDHYKTEVLNSLLKQSNLNDGVIAEMITTTQSIESDHYRTEVLTKALDHELSPTTYQKVIESVKEIESDHYITQVIKELLNKPLDSEVLTSILTLTSSIESDHYRTEILTTLLRRQTLKEEHYIKLVEYCNTMENDHYKSQTLQTALSAPNLTEGKLLAILKATQGIDSDHYITEVLVDAAPAVKKSTNAVKDAYRAAARSINSETYYGRALRAIENY